MERTQLGIFTIAENAPYAESERVSPREGQHLDAPLGRRKRCWAKRRSVLVGPSFGRRDLRLGSAIVHTLGSFGFRLGVGQ